MRRSFASFIAVFAVLAQLAVGAFAQLGFVLCVGEDHTSIELAADDDCCASHGGSAAPTVATIERDCCSDVPLFVAARPLSDLPRAHGVLAATVPVATVAGNRPLRPVAVVARADSPPLHDGISRSVVLRV